MNLSPNQLPGVGPGTDQRGDGAFLECATISGSPYPHRRTLASWKDHASLLWWRTLRELVAMSEHGGLSRQSPAVRRPIGMGVARKSRLLPNVV